MINEMVLKAYSHRERIYIYNNYFLWLCCRCE